MNLTPLQIAALPLALVVAFFLIYAVAKLIAMAVFTSWWEARDNWRRNLVNKYIKEHDTRKESK